ncbi:ATP-binding protein [Nocardioides speluncae]|uniref:ATP-binding protein n=1 Tax=Nocardioides speluncae TaxID=2670337 RepID=UPI00137AE740|nr:ATP-binding protein [Nocardioides speluncae]
MRKKVEEVIPAAGRTVHSLRDIGYELPQAIADLVDNSIEAEATAVRIDLVFDGADSWVRIADNGTGMDTDTITESLRIGSIREYGDDDLGKFGFGLKTASISQCRRVVVASRIAPQRARVEARVFDLNHIERTNRWEILVLEPDDRPIDLTEPLQTTTGTVVLWQVLDRVLTYKDPEGGWAKRKLLEQTENVAQHLGMVFHRFLSGKVRGRQKVDIFVNDAVVEPWDPFCLDEPATESLESSYYPVISEGSQGIVALHPYVLPGQSEFTDTNAWNRASGPNRWNNQQGLYIYRADRLIQWGGWNRLRTNDEHTKLARVSLDFSPELDAAFGINISKAIVKLPVDIREEIQPVIRQVCSAAQSRYRNADRSSRPKPGPRPAPRPTPGPSPMPQPVPTPSGSAGSPYGLPPTSGSDRRRTGLDLEASRSAARLALEKAAQDAGEGDALGRIMSSLQRTYPEVARDLGW